MGARGSLVVALMILVSLICRWIFVISFLCRFLTLPLLFFPSRFIVAILSDSTVTSGLATKEAFHYHSYFCTICSVNIINGCDNSIVIL